MLTFQGGDVGISSPVETFNLLRQILTMKLENYVPCNLGRTLLEPFPDIYQ